MKLKTGLMTCVIGKNTLLKIPLAVPHTETNHYYGAFSRDNTAAILVFQTSPMSVELYFHAKIVFCLSKAIWRLATRVKRPIEVLKCLYHNPTVWDHYQS